MREPRARLEHILDAIEAIEEFAVRGETAFWDDKLIPSWMLRHLQIIGEAVSALRRERPAWLEAYPDLPWDEVVGMRNRLIHEYAEIRLDLVWEAVSNGVPAIKRAVSELLDAEA